MSLQVLLPPLQLLLMSLQVLLPIQEIDWNLFLKVVKFQIQSFKVLQLLIILQTHCVILKDHLDHPETKESCLTWTAQRLLVVGGVEINKKYVSSDFLQYVTFYSM
jgi:hypothetical protein